MDVLLDVVVVGLDLQDEKVELGQVQIEGARCTSRR